MITKKLRSNLALVSSNDQYWYYKQNIDSGKTYEFFIDVIELLDKVILTGDILVADTAQREFFMKYLEEGNYPDTLTEDLKQFDQYLAGYFGPDTEGYEYSPISETYRKTLQGYENLV